MIDSTREAPRHVAEGLRSIDPGAALWYAGNGTWVLMTHRSRWEMPDNGLRRRLSGEAIIRDQWRKGNSIGPAISLGRAMIDGWFEVARYRLQGAPSSMIVEDFRVRDWRWRHELAEIERNMLDEAEGLNALKRSQERERDRAQTEGRSAFRYARGRRSFGPTTAVRH